MSLPNYEEMRRFPRRRLGRMVEIRPGMGSEPRYCLATNVSADGVRLQLNGIDLRDEFVLLFHSKDVGQDGTYKVVWRNGGEVGAKFVSAVTNNA